eukprot:c20888_g1_i2 orf=532-723(-)
MTSKDSILMEPNAAIEKLEATNCRLHPNEEKLEYMLTIQGEGFIRGHNKHSCVSTTSREIKHS